jgi:transposase
MPTNKKNPVNNSIPVKLTEDQFNEFILEHLSLGSRGPECNIPLYKVFNYIMTVIYTGMQWQQLPIELNEYGIPEIHYTRIFRIYKRWANDGSLNAAFQNSVQLLSRNQLLDLSILHGDGTSTAAKKGGDNLGFSGHKHFKGEKLVAFVDRNCNVISPFTVAAGNRHESTLFDHAFDSLKNILKNIGQSLHGLIASLDSAYDSRDNRKRIFNAGMIPNIKENPRNRKQTKRGRKRFYDDSIFQERFNTVERVFAWEDKFKRLLLRFERISLHHLGMKLIAYTMINLRHFCPT